MTSTKAYLVDVLSNFQSSEAKLTIKGLQSHSHANIMALLGPTSHKFQRKMLLCLCLPGSFTGHPGRMLGIAARTVLPEMSKLRAVFSITPIIL